MYIEKNMEGENENFSACYENWLKLFGASKLWVMKFEQVEEIFDKWTEF